MTTTTEQLLTTGDVLALAVILESAIHTAKVARADADSNITYGIARHLVDLPDGGAIGGNIDVRDRYLRVTTRSGFEVFWPVAELMREQPQGLFAQYDW